MRTRWASERKLGMVKLAIHRRRFSLMKTMLFVAFVAAVFFAGYRLGFRAGHDSETWVEVDIGDSGSMCTFTTIISCDVDVNDASTDGSNSIFESLE